MLGAPFFLACHFLRMMAIFFAFELLTHFEENGTIWILLKLEMALLQQQEANI